MGLVDIANDVHTLTGEVLAAAFQVSNSLGCGFLEKVYENALVMELRESGLNVLQQVKFDVLYKERSVGEYVADIIVGGRVIVEVKALRALERTHRAQTINYLKATRLSAALLLNFGQPRLEYERLLN